MARRRRGEGEQRLQDALAGAIRRGVEYHGQEVGLTDYGVVIGVDPVVVELTGGADTKELEQLSPAQAVLQYEADVGLEEDDTLVLLRVHGDWVAIAVLSDHEPTP